jgi:hypothetical protein
VADTGANNDKTNQRVTNAIIKKDVEHRTDMFRDFRTEVRDSNKLQNGKIHDLEIAQTTIRAQVRNWNGLNSLGVLVASALGALGIKQ